ncbi:hypothetical protein [Deinococcus sonorensis]|uniref:Delta-60 repeat domain-containing protein n=2 Tax=Deinococcus sonorensis TaxID=309891 RepID=A0AAU7U5R5_9DEIO
MRRTGSLMGVMLCAALAGCGRPAVPSSATLIPQALGASGTLDPAYGQQGLAQLPASRARLVGSTLQTNNQVLVTVQSASSGRVASRVLRVTARGQADSSFGQAGSLVFPDADVATAVICPDGANADNDWSAECADPQRPLVAWSTLSTERLTLARFLPSGQPDPTFGQQGQVTVAFSVGAVKAVAIQADGKIVVLGQAALARFRRNGAPDLSFGQGGRTALPADPDAEVQDLAMDDAERFLVLRTSATDTGNQTVVLRYTPAGQLDRRYGHAGSVTLDFGPLGMGRSLLLQDSGRLVIGGAGGLWRLRPDGTPDPGFGTAGHADYPDADHGGFDISDLAEDQNHRLVASVLTSERFRPDFKANLARFQRTGQLDSSFAAGGLSHVRVCDACDISGGLAEFDAVHVLPSGRLLGAGTTGHGTTVMVARMYP